MSAPRRPITARPVSLASRVTSHQEEDRMRRDLRQVILGMKDSILTNSELAERLAQRANTVGMMPFNIDGPYLQMIVRKYR